MEKINEIAKMIDHSLLHPALTDEEIINGCHLANKYNVASVCVKPYSVKLARSILINSEVAVGSVVGFPHGNSSIAIKALETEQICKDGATEIDMVVNIGKVLSEDWTYIKDEIEAIHKIAIQNHSILKVIFENDYLKNNKYKIKLCEICNELNVDFVKTSTGFGFKKDQNNNYNYDGAVDSDLELMRTRSNKNIEIKAAGKIRSLDDLLRVKKLGATRVGATATKEIMDAAKY